MAEQNFKNHARLIFSYHVLTGLALGALITGAFFNLFSPSGNAFSEGLMFALITFSLLSIFFHCRGFALKAQDRAIRAEEGLRYFIITGKALDKRLTISQIIALRFASDGELPALAEEAVEKSLSNKAIKQSIRNWRADNHRV